MCLSCSNLFTCTHSHAPFEQAFSGLVDRDNRPAYSFEYDSTLINYHHEKAYEYGLHA